MNSFLNQVSLTSIGKNLTQPIRLLWLIVGCVFSLNLNAAEIHVAVAANFYPALEQLVESFERETGHHLVLVSGSSGKLVAQIAQGAPFDLFLSADVNRAEFLQNEGFIIDGFRSTYALGRLVVIAKEIDRTTSEALRPLELLKRQQFSQLSIANPRLAPYGLAAMQVLESMSLEPENKKLIYGENVSQAFHFFQIGRTDLAILSFSQVLGLGINPDQYEEIPQSYYQPIEQQMVLLKKPNSSSEEQGSSALDKIKAAKALYWYLLSQRVQNRVVELGYFPLDELNNE